jgi:hypothetical protein
LTVNFPWGSLLHGILGRDDAVLAGIAQLLAPGAVGLVLVSVVPRDGVPAVPSLGALRATYARHGLELIGVRPATRDEVIASRSSWAKRLRAGTARPVTLLRLRAHSQRHDVPALLEQATLGHKALDPCADGAVVRLPHCPNVARPGLHDVFVL